MKVIDLLNKIANGEEVPLVLKYNNKIYEYTKEIDWYLREDLKSELFIDKSRLNDEVEIIDEKEMCHKCHKYPAEYNQTWCEFCLGISKEEKKIPEKLTDILKVDDLIPPVDENMYKIWKQTIKNHNKINEICDYLKSKGE